MDGTISVRSKGLTANLLELHFTDESKVCRNVSMHKDKGVYFHVRMCQ